MPESHIIASGVEDLGREIAGETGAMVASVAYGVTTVAANLYAGKVALQQTGHAPIKVNMNQLVNNPADEFVTIGSADGVIGGYCKTIPTSGYGKIYVTQIAKGYYMIANGHHRVEALKQLGKTTLKESITK